MYNFYTIIYKLPPMYFFTIFYFYFKITSIVFSSLVINDWQKIISPLVTDTIFSMYGKKFDLKKEGSSKKFPISIAPMSR